jgi:cell division protease FtsH
MPPTGPPRNPDGPPLPPPTRKASPVMAFVIILGALLIVSFVATWLFVPAQKTISYDKFLGLVDRGQISKITLVGGAKIQGETRDNENEFVKELKLPNGRFSVVLPHIDNLDPLLREIRDKDYKVNKEAIDGKDKQPVQINPEEDQGQWVGPLLWGVLPMVLILLFFFFFLPRMRDPMGGAYNSFVRSPARRYEKGRTRTGFDEVAGMEHAKKELQEVVEFLKSPDKFHRLGAQVPKGVLLIGPPGTGKTLLARAVAGEAGVPFYSINGSEFIQMFVGVGATRVRDLFRTAKENAPCLIFIDEIDAVGRMRGAGVGGGSDEREQTLNQILSEMDGFQPNETIIVLAATNRPDVLDSALLRPGRFDRHVTVDRPTWQGRLAILKVHVRNKPLGDDVDLERLARRTIGMSGADLRNLANEAALIATREDKNRIDKKDFELAYDRIKMGASREEPLTVVEKRRTAYHEAGHALCALYQPESDPLVKVSIIPRGMAGGVTWSQPDEDRIDVSQTEMMAKLVMALGGRAADRLVYGQANSGASQDLKQATRLARMMVTQFGMSDKLGPVAYRTGEEHTFLGKDIYESRDFSEGTARLIDEEVQRLLLEADRRAYDLLVERRAELERLVDALVQEEEMDRDEVEKLLGISKPLTSNGRLEGAVNSAAISNPV